MLLVLDALVCKCRGNPEQAPARSENWKPAAARYVLLLRELPALHDWRGPRSLAATHFTIASYHQKMYVAKIIICYCKCLQHFIGTKSVGYAGSPAFSAIKNTPAKLPRPRTVNGEMAPWIQPVAPLRRRHAVPRSRPRTCSSDRCVGCCKAWQR